MIENVSEISLLCICSKLKHYVQIYKLWLVKAFIYDNRRGGEEGSSRMVHCDKLGG